MSNKNKVAKLRYFPNGFRPISPGDHVICTVSHEKIMLEDLRYWSVELQQPYATAEISAQAHIDALNA